MSLDRRAFSTLTLMGGAALMTGAVRAQAALMPAEAQEIAREAWQYSYAVLQGYQTMFNQTQNKAFPGYIGGFNRFRHYARAATPADVDIVTPNNDTPYSWAWLDLRAEPIVLSLPEVPAPRYYVNQWFDMYTHNFAYTGVRTTGRKAGTYLLAGPRWRGKVPEGIDKVFTTETEFVGTLTRTQLFGPDDVAALQAIQAGYVLTPLSQFTGTEAPPAAPPVNWPAWDAATAEGPAFIGYLNALLPFMPTPASEAEMFARFARIGIGSGLAFDPDMLDPAIRAAIASGAAQAAQALRDAAIKTTESRNVFGSREALGPEYIERRNIGAMLGIYGNSKEEAVYGTQQTDSAGNIFDGNRQWVLRFEPGQLPPVSEFWSITMYNLPQRLLVDNPIKRYSINGQTPGLKLGPDGALEIFIQAQTPGSDKESNWLPAPPGPFFFAARFYGPGPALIDGSWRLPPLVERK
jgi:hypothetical protein